MSVQPQMEFQDIVSTNTRRLKPDILSGASDPASSRAANNYDSAAKHGEKQ